MGVCVCVLLSNQRILIQFGVPIFALNPVNHPSLATCPTFHFQVSSFILKITLRCGALDYYFEKKIYLLYIFIVVHFW